MRDGQTFTGNEVWDVAEGEEMQVVINEALAKKYFPGVDPIGRRVETGFDAPARPLSSNTRRAAGNRAATSFPIPAY